MMNTAHDQLHDAGFGKHGFVGRNVGQDAAECDRAEKQGFESFGKCQIQQHNADDNHDGMTRRNCYEAAVH